jgi:hypothetical protein
VNSLTLHWHVGGPGSATFSLVLSQETVAVHTTYVGDGLGSMLQVALDLQGGSSSAIGFLPAEPGGTCLFFSGADTDTYLQVVRFDEMSSEDRRWSGGKLCWHGRLDVELFIAQVAVMAADVLVNCGGTEAYSATWGGIAFPADKLDQLRSGMAK